jgi:hypothetical protein
MFRRMLLATALAGAATASLAIDPSEVAAPGVCAGEERDLAVRAASGRAKGQAASDGVPVQLLLSPEQVAAGGGPLALDLPAPSTFAGPGACDSPGSGCTSSKLDDPDPGTGCGFPGSPCP